VFEFISGGGFNQQTLPESLAKEGSLMLQAVLDDFAKLRQIKITVMLDWRFVDRINSHYATTDIIKPEQDYQQRFLQLAQQADAIWPIAPESDGILQQLCQTVTDLGKILLTSNAAAVALAGNKYLSYQRLCQYKIATVNTHLLNAFRFTTGEWLVKPVDGVGCQDSYIINNETDLAKLVGSPENYLIQPHLQGQKTSLSCLCKQGRAWLLSVNIQHFAIENQQYQLTSITVNQSSQHSRYQPLCQAVAAAMPDLWGYVGIDLIETRDDILVLEINPRLTTSFTGINRALGINVAEQVLRLLHDQPQLQATQNFKVTISI